MKLLDKLKNALFEEEYVEVEEKPKKKIGKQSKVKKEEPKSEKPIVKKIVQPEKPKIVKSEQEEVIDEEDIQEESELKNNKEFKFPMMDDFDFEVEQLDVEPKIEVNNKKPEVKEVKKVQPIKEKKSKPYGLDDFELPEKEHGLYEKKEERTYFKPSPIISPIYGILDKNYKKEEIRDKKEVRLTSSYAHENLDLDEVRNRAYGRLDDDIKHEIQKDSKIDYDDELDEGQLVDLSTDKDTPEVKEVTVADAEEYFEDLGLEYNVDYKDISKEKANGRRSQKITEEPESEEIQEPVVESKQSIDIEDSTSNNDESDDDNLFDLIDSMYDKD